MTILRWPVLLATIVAVPPAHSSSLPVSYSSAGGSVNAIGNQLSGGTYDQLALGALSGTVDSTGYYELNSISFTVGPNTTLTTQYSASGTLTENVTINGITAPVSMAYTDTINDRAYPNSGCNIFYCSTTYPDDALTISSGSPVAFGPNVELNFLYQSGTLVSGGGTVNATLYAYITNNTPAPPPPPPVPLPASAWLMLSGLGGLGAMVRRRRAA